MFKTLGSVLPTLKGPNLIVSRNPRDCFANPRMHECNKSFKEWNSGLIIRQKDLSGFKYLKGLSKENLKDFENLSGMSIF